MYFQHMKALIFSYFDEEEKMNRCRYGIEHAADYMKSGYEQELHLTKTQHDETRRMIKRLIDISEDDMR